MTLRKTNTHILIIRMTVAVMSAVMLHPVTATLGKIPASAFLARDSQRLVLASCEIVALSQHRSPSSVNRSEGIARLSGSRQMWQFIEGEVSERIFHKHRSSGPMVLVSGRRTVIVRGEYVALHTSRQQVASYEGC